MMKREKKIQDFTEGALFVKIVFYLLPCMATVFLQLLFNTADTAMVGRWGGDTPLEREIALAAVGSCGSLISLIVNVFMGLSNGVSVCVAHDIGAKDHDAVRRTVHTALLTALLCGTSIMVLGIIFTRSLLVLMGTEPLVLEAAVPYMRAYFLGIPATMIYNYCSAALGASGDAKRPLLFISVGGGLNVLFNFVAVVLLRWGAMGVGVATAISQWVSCGMILYYMTHLNGMCRIERKWLSMDFHALKRIAFVGLPAGFANSLLSFSNVQVQTALNSLGHVAVAGNTAAANIDGYMSVIHNSIDSATVTFVGQNVGAKKRDRVKKTLFYALLLVTVADLSIGGLLLLLGRPLIGFFAPGNSAVVEAGMVRLSWLAPTLFLGGIMSMLNAAARGSGNSLGVSITSLITLAGSRVIWVHTAFASSSTSNVLYASYPISWLVGGIGALACFLYSYRKLRRRALL